MRVKSSLMAALGSVAGAAVAVVTYQSQVVVEPARVSSVPRPEPVSAATYPHHVTVLWMPCARGSHRRGEACVHVQHRVVTLVLPAAPARVAPAPVTRRGAAVPPPTRSSAEHETRHETEHETDHETEHANEDHAEPHDD